ncbi:MAG: DUF5407 family protein [Chlamydia sp.]
MADGGYQDPWSDLGTAKWFGKKVGVQFHYLVDSIEQLTMIAKSKIAMIRSQKSSMSIADMFDLQMAMNRLSQFSEMSTSLISAINTSISSMARNVKG